MDLVAGETAPVVAGKLESINGKLLFNYGKSYLERIHDRVPAIAIYPAELPLQSGRIPFLGFTTVLLEGHVNKSTTLSLSGFLRLSQSGLTPRG